MAGKIISLVSTKGGSGKSTLALCLPYAKPFRDKRAVVLEADAQSSLSNWQAERKRQGRSAAVPVETFYSEKAGPLLDRLEELARKHDLVIADLPGESRAYTRTRIALGVSDLVLIPMRASEFDMDSALSHVLPLLEQAREKSIRETRYFIVPTMVHHAATVERTVQIFEGTDAQVLPAVLPFRKVFADFPEAGRTLEEYAREATPRGQRKQAKKVMGDVDRIAGAIAKMLGFH